jgi:peroxiredoxin
MVFVLLATILGAFSKAEAQPWLVSGSVKGIKDTIEKVFIVYRKDDARQTDSTLVINGKFSFRGNFEEPVKAMVYLKFASKAPASKQIDYGRDAVSIFIEPGAEVAINCKSEKFAEADINGGSINTELKKIEEGEKKYDAKINALYETYSAARRDKNKPLADSLEKQIDALDSTKTEDVYGTYIKAHPASPIAVFVLQDYAGYEIDATKIEPLFNKLPGSQKKYAVGEKLRNRIDIAKITGIGRPAPEFSQADTLGIPVSLASFKGKYVLLDFWASWCGPCRRENPNVVAAFNKFKDKGFSILSVSLDQPGAKDKWMKAIHDDKLTWTHVSDLKFWDNAVAKQYGIQAIPQNLLIDPQGKIVAKDLRGEDLEKKLEGLFTN